MTAIRRRLFAATWLILTAQTLALAVGMAQVCREGEHTHGGVAAPDCPMHHHAPTTAEGVQHAHHGHPASPSDVPEGGPQITCRCSNDAPSAYLGPMAIVDGPLTDAPFVEASVVTPPPDPSAPDHEYSSPSPPPR